MSLDTKYRPTDYVDVVGQEGSVTVLRQFVATDAGWHQSYLFCGPHGSGKTTLGRILARALLCDNAEGGNPCNECPSCVSILKNGSSESFTEIDAATNSGKADIKQITEELQYATYSGKPRLYLFDEAHELSRQALDGLLKPMEDNRPGSDNKQLVCIFCTTEPEKMRATIFSRCAPAFTIRQVEPEKIAERLAFVCEQEGIEYDQDALVLIAEVTESHIRDALKAVEGVSKLGRINQENVREYLHLGAATLALDVLVNLGLDQTTVIAAVESMGRFMSPAQAYKQIAEAAMTVYRVSLGVGKTPSYWDGETVQAAVANQGNFLLVIADHLATRPSRPSSSMLMCDMAFLHHRKLGSLPVAPVVPPPTTIAAPAPQKAALPAPAELAVSTPELPRSKDDMPPSPIAGKVSTDPVNSDPGSEKAAVPQGIAERMEGSVDQSNGGIPPLEVDLFRAVLRRRIAELKAGRGSGPTGWSNLGGG